MNVISRELLKLVTNCEKARVHTENKYRLKFHLMPPTGWLNDPNGLCQFHGEYHVFFQYTPFDSTGGLKVWGHYVSRDLLNWEYRGTPIMPDQPWDCHGVYSGSTFIENDEMYIYYTGNVKFPGDYDYISDGRGSNTILITSKDGKNFSEKKCLLEMEDYPKNYTNHIRDPKIIKVDGAYYMVLGGRRKDDHGAVLLYKSEDLIKWEYHKELTTKDAFGYMWECPDLMEIDGDWFLGICPQGVEREEYRFQNIYQSGYYVGEGEYLGDYKLNDFVEWDMGFDFYAPQTFIDENGRRILIGWAGLPDIDNEYKNLTIEEEWQHALTIPRVITKQEKKLYQYPVEELKDLRTSKIDFNSNEKLTIQEGIFDLEITNIKSKKIQIQISDGLVLQYENDVFSMKFTGNLGAGRTERKAIVKELNEVRILCDVSLMEVYLNHGEYVFTTRFYGEDAPLTVLVDSEDSVNTLWKMRDMEVNYEK
ncbi:MAG: glycoside hydrolase family 32 protein [bacterium]|nr:glycoside hydrolase family 32 protein [bacterium]